MQIENLKVSRIAIHEVFQREEDRKPVAPVYADQLESLSPEAATTFRERVTEALSAQAKSIEMELKEHDAQSHVACAGDLIASTDSAFLKESRRVADQLTSAQMHRNIPGGMLIVFDGTVSTESHQFLGVIKAETQSGFRRTQDEKHKLVTEFLNNVFLTLACTRFRRHRVRCFDGTGGASWSVGSLRESSSLKLCA